MKEHNEIKVKSPFKVPENYFEEVNRKIILSTAGQTSEIKGKTLYRRLRPYLAVAASVAVIVMLSFTAKYYFSSLKERSGIPAITLNEFSDNYLNDIDILTLEESAGISGADLVKLEVNSKDIIDYLVLENIDINDIFEQL